MNYKTGERVKDNLREFVYSRHPGFRRVRKGGSDGPVQSRFGATTLPTLFESAPPIWTVKIYAQVRGLRALPLKTLVPTVQI